MNDEDWLDLSRYPNLDPDQAVEPHQLDRLHDALHAAPVQPLGDELWRDLLAGYATSDTADPAAPPAASAQTPDSSWDGGPDSLQEQRVFLHPLDHAAHGGYDVHDGFDAHHGYDVHDEYDAHNGYDLHLPD